MNETNKYHRVVRDLHQPIIQATVDVYSVLEAFRVECPARQHAIKKLLCAGLRGKGDAMQDLQETLQAVSRAIELQSERQKSTPA